MKYLWRHLHIFLGRFCSFFESRKTSAEVVPSRDTQSHRVIDEEKLDSGVCKRKKLVSSSEPVSLETYFLKVVEIGLW